jgi:SpoVK/Ycf46/Vps4 family AAA+-type ATPase
MRQICLFAENARVMALAATNRPSELHEAILRRFTQIFEIGVPVQSERSKILPGCVEGLLKMSRQTLIMITLHFYVRALLDRTS